MGYDIEGAGQQVTDKDECRALCKAIPGCNALSFNQLSMWCAVKHLPAVVRPTHTDAFAALRVCDDAPGEIPMS